MAVPLRVTRAHGRRDHLPALDGVRGLAILMVIGSHAFASNSAQSGPVFRWVGDLLGYGFFGVDLFFVLSGFLITGILVDSRSTGHFFRNFYARRALRIFPLYYGVLLALFLLTPRLHLQWHGMAWLMLGYLQNFRPNDVVAYSPGAGLALNHFWSLAVEEQFYLLWPAVVFVVRDRRRLLWVTVGISAFALALRLALVAAGVGANLIHVTTITRADSLLLGGALALLYRSAAWAKVERGARYAFLAAAGGVAASIALLPRELGEHPVFPLADRLWLDGARYTVLAVASASLIAWALQPSSVAARLFRQGWIRFFGRYSYGIYVLHMVPLGLLVGSQRALLLRLTHSKALAVAGAGVSSLGLAVLAAYVSFHLYERSFLRLKRHFASPSSRPVRLPEQVAVGAMASPLVDLKSYTQEVSLR